MRKSEIGKPEGHGIVRGDARSSRSSLFEGRFGRMFRDLPPASWPEAALRKLGEAIISCPERDPVDRDLPAAEPEIDCVLQDEEENSGIPAGYTYLGQFIDHDLTFDPASSLQKLNDPDALVDFRTPRLDLDCLYGRGPDDQPYMYVDRKFRLGAPLQEQDKPSKRRDLPRYVDVEDPARPQRALIGDKRNDENVIVSQLHDSMLQFHNKLADIHQTSPFSEIQRLVRWHYQWIVVNDYLKIICGPEVIDEILPHRNKQCPAWEKALRLHFYKWRHDAFMPVEFSAAAFRFGHSMVRPIYRLNTQMHGGDDPARATPSEKARGLEGRLFIFAGVHRRGLNIFDIIPKEWAIDWSLFFDIDGSGTTGGTKRAQPSYKIDTALVNPLRYLPEFSIVGALQRPLTIPQLQPPPKDDKADPAILATRNLLRGMAMQLPSGQSIAAAMGVDCISDQCLRVGKATLEDYPKNPRLIDLCPSFIGKAPLWYYVLAEAQHEWFARATAPNGKGDEEPMTLGSVGKRIVAETLIGILAADGSSYLRQDPNWQPGIDGTHIGTMGDLLKFVDT